jgi:leucine dehydrogenase
MQHREKPAWTSFLLPISTPTNRLCFAYDAADRSEGHDLAIHSTRLGPALGGCRMWNYASEAEALTDVLRLSRGMSYKSALADMPLGGGKSVILGDSRSHKTPALMQAMGQAVDRLGGRYIVAEDVGTSTADMTAIHMPRPATLSA